MAKNLNRKKNILDKHKNNFILMNILAISVVLITQNAEATPIEWKISDGGNGHFYEVVVVSKGISWSNAQKLALNKGGYLATLTSATENAFVYALASPDKVPLAWHWNSITQWGPWLGGLKQNGVWYWVNGEGNFSYKNWAPGEPSGEYLLQFLNNYGSIGTWNDAWTTDIMTGLVIEWENLSPTSLNLSAISPNGIQLVWNKFSGVKGYRIQRKDGNCSSSNPWSILTDINASTNSFQDWYLTANTAYSYRIANYYGGQTFSAYSACVSTTTALAGTPRSPGGIRAISQSNSQVDLQWWDNSENETRFEIYRKVNGGSWALLKTTAANVKTSSDTTATGNTNTTHYSYDVRACNAAGCSVAKPSPIVPFRPTNLTATVATAVKLNWTDNSDNETAFQVWRKNGGCNSSSPWLAVKYGLAANSTTFNDGSAVSGDIYSYQVRAANRIFPAWVNSPFALSDFSGCVSTTAP